MPSCNQKKRLQKQDENKIKARAPYKANPENKKTSVRDNYKADPEKKVSAGTRQTAGLAEPVRQVRRPPDHYFSLPHPFSNLLTDYNMNCIYLQFSNLAAITFYLLLSLFIVIIG